ncbi:MAG: peptidylprolyl isomerase [Tepidiformaceae bacterium]
MARRERTTALPKHHRRQRAVHGRTFAGRQIGERHVRWGILGVAGALLVLVIGIWSWNYYSDNYSKPRETVLRVGDERVTLSYYTDRLLPFLQSNANSSTVPLIELALLTKLEEELLTVAIAREKGLDLSAAAIDRAIAEELGVPVGGSGSAFDSLYRSQLKTLKMSNDNYRRLITAQVAQEKLLDGLRVEVGEKGEAVTLRVVVVQLKEQAETILGRIRGGEDMGAIAQRESADLSRTEDGLRQPQPPGLLNDQVQAALAGKPDGELAGPFEIDGNFWVVRLEKRDPEFAYSDDLKGALALLKLDEAIKARRATLKVAQDFDSGDAKWAEEHVN